MVCQLPTPRSSEKVIAIFPGAKIVITEEILHNLQSPHHVPSRGGLPSVVILKMARSRRHGSGMFIVPMCRTHKGFALFLSDSLKIGSTATIIWSDSGCAAAVAEDYVDDHQIRYNEEYRGHSLSAND